MLALWSTPRQKTTADPLDAPSSVEVNLFETPLDVARVLFGYLYHGRVDEACLDGEEGISKSADLLVLADELGVQHLFDFAQLWLANQQERWSWVGFESRVRVCWIRVRTRMEAMGCSVCVLHPDAGGGEDSSGRRRCAELGECSGASSGGSPLKVEQKGMKKGPESEATKIVARSGLTEVGFGRWSVPPALGDATDAACGFDQSSDVRPSPSFDSGHAF